MRSGTPSSDTMTLKAVKQMILEATLEKLRKAWGLSNTGKHLKKIETTESTAVKYSLPTPRLMGAQQGFFGTRDLPLFVTGLREIGF